MTEALCLRAGGYQGEASVHTRGLRVLAESLNRRSGGDATLAIDPDITADGRPAAALLEDVERGATDLCYFASSYLAAAVPALALFDVPFGTSDRADAFRRLDGELGAALRNTVEAATGYTVLAFWDNGFRHLSNARHPIRHPDDCRGLTIRTLGSSLHGEVFAALGFAPRMIDVKDLAAAVRTGAIDAQENPLTNTVNFGLHLTHRHHSLTGHFFGVALLLANRRAAAAWTSAQRALIEAAVADATAAQRRLAIDEDTRCLAVLEAAAAEIVPHDALDLDAFRRAVADIRAREIARLDPALALGYGLLGAG